MEAALVTVVRRTGWLSRGAGAVAALAGAGAPNSRLNRFPPTYPNPIMTKWTGRLWALLGSLALVGVVAACSSPLELRVQGTSDMNGGGNPATVRVYMLSGEASFTAPSAAQFWSDDVGVLGDALVGTPRDLRVYPGETQTLAFEPAKDVQFVGIAADLRNPDESGWRTIYAVDRIKGKAIAITVLPDRLDVRVQ